MVVLNGSNVLLDIRVNEVIASDLCVFSVLEVLFKETYICNDFIIGEWYLTHIVQHDIPRSDRSNHTDYRVCLKCSCAAHGQSRSFHSTLTYTGFSVHWTGGSIQHRSSILLLVVLRTASSVMSNLEDPSEWDYVDAGLCAAHIWHSGTVSWIG